MFCSILVSLRHPLSTQTSCEELFQNIEQLCFHMKTATFLFIFCVWLLLRWVRLVLSSPLPNKILPKVIFWYFDSLSESQDKYHCATKKPILVLSYSQMLTVYFRFHTFSLYSLHLQIISTDVSSGQSELLTVRSIHRLAISAPPPPKTHETSLGSL